MKTPARKLAASLRMRPVQQKPKVHARGKGEYVRSKAKQILARVAGDSEQREEIGNVR